MDMKWAPKIFAGSSYRLTVHCKPYGPGSNNGSGGDTTNHGTVTKLLVIKDYPKYF